MSEQNQRYRSATNYVDENDAKTKFQMMDNLLQEISKMNEVVKIIDTRIFVADRTWIGLEEKIKEIKTKLEALINVVCNAPNGPIRLIKVTAYK